MLLIFVLFGPWVLTTIYGPQYAEGATILAVLSVGRLVAVWAGLRGRHAHDDRQPEGHDEGDVDVRRVSVAAGIAGAYYFGAIGVACATTFAQILQNSIQLTLVRRRLGIWTMIHFDPREL